VAGHVVAHRPSDHPAWVARVGGVESNVEIDILAQAALGQLIRADEEEAGQQQRGGPESRAVKPTAGQSRWLGPDWIELLLSHCTLPMTVHAEQRSACMYGHDREGLDVLCYLSELGGSPRACVCGLTMRQGKRRGKTRYN
jgi:hypothetical protein